MASGKMNRDIAGSLYQVNQTGWPVVSRSRQELLHDLSVHVRQAEVATLELVDQTLVVDAQHVQDRRLQVVHGHRVRGDVVAEIVRLAENGPPLHPSAGDPHAEVARMVIAPAVGVGELALAEDRPAELPAPDDQRLVEETALLEIRDERCHRLIRTAAASRRT